MLNQGVTLTDLQEAEKTFSRSRAERRAREQQEKDEKEKQDVEKQDEKEKPLISQDAEDYRQRWSRTQEKEVSSTFLNVLIGRKQKGSDTMCTFIGLRHKH